VSNVPLRLDRAPVALGIYTLLAVALTWPLVTHLSSRIAWDLGDPVFNSWILMWTGGQVLAALHGDFNALHDYWNGNIFYPERLTIGYSEHLTPQMLQALPFFGTTGSIVLGYNLVFLATIAMSGWAMYLLVRELTNRPIAAFVAGLAFAFAPYRIPQGPHIQELSSQWMPLVLYGFRRYFVTQRTRALVGGSAALVFQNLSCGYFLLFFAPFAGVYCLYEMADRRLLRNVRVWASLLAALVIVAAITWPFLGPYLKLRRMSEVGTRTYREAVEFSADVYSFATASAASVEGKMIAAFPKGEGEGFPGLAILTLAATGVVAGVRRARGTVVAAKKTSGVIFGSALGVNLALVLVLLLNGSLPIDVGGEPYHDVAPLLISAAVLAIAWIALSARARQFVRGVSGSTFGFFAAATVVAALLALGPDVLSAGRPVGHGPYQLLFAYVPGFNGVRVPARYLMVVACFLAVLVGLGAAEILARVRARSALALLAVASVVMLVEGSVVPLPTNAPLAVHGYAPTPRVLGTERDMSPLYQHVRDAPGSVLIEFPFGEPAYDILATYYAGYHRRPLVNGYSGFFPESFLRRATFLDHIPADLDTAYKAVQGSGATLAIVHESAYLDGRGHEITDWLMSHGATVVASDDGDRLLQLR
jgi:hypothetical protein